MNERIKKWMKYENIKSSELASIILVNRATISHILSGRNKPSLDFLQKLLNNYPELNANWLITGIGFMHQDQEKVNDKSSKSINKVVIFYNDKSFDELNP
tara:strand:+ start:361 stop:660 length:300 start_codon:yes stop_codon:yes gene_type:complete